MYQLSDTPSGLRTPGQKGIEIRLWQVYILRNRTNLLNTLSAYSLENAPRPADIMDEERISYRFLIHDWEKTIRPLLIKNAIPFEAGIHFNVDVFHKTEKKKVYLVEDDLDILFALNLILEDAGYDVLLSHSAKPLMERKLPDTDVFILDKMMPDGDGLEICEHLRARAETKNTPVIMMTAAHNAYSKAVTAGVTDFLKKPFDTQDLLRMVSKYTKPVLY